MKLNEIQIVRHGCELQVKPTSKQNQVVLLSFWRSEFASFVDSRNEAHDENVVPSGFQKYPAKTTGKRTTERI